MIVLFSLGIVQALFLSFLIASRRGNSLSQKLLVTWLLTLVANLVFFLVSFSNTIIAFDLMLLFWGIETVHGPLLYLYTRSAVDDHFKIRIRDWVHVIPYLIICSTIFYYHYFTPNWIKLLNGYIVFKEGAPLILTLMAWVIKVITVLYLLAGFLLIRRVRESRALFFSRLEKINLFWLNNFLRGILAAYIFSYGAIPYFFGIKDLTDNEIGVVNTLVSVFFTFYAAYVNHRHQQDLIQTSAMGHIIELQKVAGRYKKTGLSPEKAVELKGQLLTYMAREKPYLNSSLTLRDVSDGLGISTNYLSQLLNENLGMNFFNFVNDYRIEEFRQRILKGDHLQFSLVGVALDCGFSSKSSFYAVFKRVLKTTPADFVHDLDASSKLRSVS